MMTDERFDETTAEARPGETAEGGEAHGSAEPAETAEAGAPEVAGTESVPEAADPQLESLRVELEALNDRHLRLAAEFDNYRKRNERERAELWTRAQADLVTRLLEVLDDLQRVADHEAEQGTIGALLDGVRLVEKKYRRVLESAGLEPIDAEGEFFNPATMEALMTVPAERPEDDDLVADVFQQGYRFKDVLIRPARVRVRKYEA
ncbi:MAG TPA: nucleotide exchange factor GrpE [Longimicrobiales bacterium]